MEQGDIIPLSGDSPFDRESIASIVFEEDEDNSAIVIPDVNSFRE